MSTQQITINTLLEEQYQIQKDPDDPSRLRISEATDPSQPSYYAFQLRDIIQKEADCQKRVSLLFSSALSPELYEMLQEVNRNNIKVRLPGTAQYSISRLNRVIKREAKQVMNEIKMVDHQLALPLNDLDLSFPLKGITPNGEIFYIDEIRETEINQADGIQHDDIKRNEIHDINTLTKMIQRMRKYYKRQRRLLEENNGVITADNCENAYRMFWFFENFNEPARTLAERFYNQAKEEREQKPRKTHRLVIRDHNFKMIGGITLDMQYEKGSLCTQGDIGYFIDPKRHGKKYVSSAIYRLLPFYFRNHKELSIDIVTRKTLDENRPSNNGYANNVCSQLVAHKLGATVTNERPAEGFSKYTPWRLRRDIFLMRNLNQILCTIMGPSVVDHQKRVPSPLVGQRKARNKGG